MTSNDPRSGVDEDRGGGDDGGMETRLRRVEDAIIRIDAVLPSLSTKADMHIEISNQTWRIVGWMTGICASLVAVTYLVASAIK